MQPPECDQNCSAFAIPPVEEIEPSQRFDKFPARHRDIPKRDGRRGAHFVVRDGLVGRCRTRREVFCAGSNAIEGDPIQLGAIGENHVGGIVNKRDQCADGERDHFARFEVESEMVSGG
mmetsp:Transcript_25821/g.43304  ORF Transcript_25821/g.43304 Transcript_25821/m.43304 type:complete len:119 (+) Transcript_25821:525-881(+)